MWINLAEQQTSCLNRWTLWKVGCFSRSCICEASSSQILSATFWVVAFKGIKEFFSFGVHLPHPRPPNPVSVPGRLTRLSDVNQAQQVQQFEEHDDQADDANSLKSLRLPPHTHLLLGIYFFSRPILFLSLHCCIPCIFWPIPAVLAKFPSLFCCSDFSVWSFVSKISFSYSPQPRGAAKHPCFAGEVSNDSCKNISKKKTRHGKSSKHSLIPW